MTVSLGTIPASAAPDVQQAIRDLHTALGTLLGDQNIDLGGRRIINAGTSVDAHDYVRHDELTGTVGRGTNAATGVSAFVGGGGITLTLANGILTITNAGVTSAIGTTHQVTVSSATGAVTFSLPQDIHTSATPQFSGVYIYDVNNTLVHGFAVTLP